MGQDPRLDGRLMRPRDEARRVALGTARELLAQAPNRKALFEAFAEWWRHPGHTHRHPDGGTPRPSIESLVARLRELGREDLATFASGPWLKQGPLNQVLWQFTILAGESFAQPFVEALKAGNWREPNFYGLDAMGAFDAFDLALREELKQDATATDAALRRLSASVDAAKRDPTASLPQDDRHGSRVRERVTRYRTSPQIDEVWAQNFDPPTWPEHAFLWDVLLDVRPQDTIALLAEMPHPLMIRSCHRTQRLADRPDEIARLIAIAPPAFVGAEYQANGSMVVLLLEVASDAIENTAHNPDGSLITVAADTPELLNPPAEKCREATRTILDALFARPDAELLAWAWLEQMVSDLRLRGVPAFVEGKGCLNLPMLAIHLLASRLHPRTDYRQWIEQREEIWRIYRLTTTLAVAVFTQSRDTKETTAILEWALLKGGVAYLGINNAMTNPGDVVAAIGGKAICTLDDPPAWFVRIWQRLRPIRERNWRAGTRGDERNSTGELCGLWGVAALEFLPSSHRSALWASVEIAIRDAWQTDSYIYAPNWSKLLFRLLKSFEPQTGAGLGTRESQLSRVLLPYIEADLAFLDAIIDLRDQGWSIDLMRDAVSMAGFDLGDLVTELLAMKERVFKLPHAPLDRRLDDDLRTFKCIYCLRELDRRSYTKAEHVLPQSFGTFVQNFTLHEIVCDDCNHYFGNNLEIFLARDTYEGQLRFAHGVKYASDYKELAKSTRVAIKYAEGEYAGRYVTRRYSKEKDTIEVTPLPQVGFLVSDERYEYCLLDNIPTLAELQEKGFDGNRPRSIHALAVDLADLQRLLAERGISFRFTDSDSPSDRPDSILCEFEGTIDHIIRRAIAKISFNYLAYFQGAALLHRSEFDMARQYIRYGTMPDYQMMSIDEVAILEGEPLEGLRVLGHIITTAWTSVNSALAQVSLFNWMTYRISLTKEFEAPDQEIRRGHIFDLANRKIYELGSRPLETPDA
jgi:hypothetical protein